MEQLWLEYGRLSPVQRLFTALRDLVVTNGRAPYVVFVDEVDTVRSLPFSTNEFFAAIRESHNRRAEDSDLERLTFCLLGTALPNDLIADPQMTPFNIGTHIVLTDFTPEEAAPLARGLDRPARVAEDLMDRILYWTGGHPYLTQRLCKALLSDASLQTSAAVDDLCHGLFLSPRAREEDDNLTYVRESLMRCREARGALELYARIRSGEAVGTALTDPASSRLELTGLLRRGQGGLEVRNRIYAHVFNPAWIARQLDCLRCR